MIPSIALAVALAMPAPAATPLRTITHVHVSPLCTGLRRNIGPAIGKVLQSDHYIAQSRPLFRNYVQAESTGSASKDLTVSRLETLIRPLVQNSDAIEKLLNDPYVFPRVAISDSDRQLLEMRAQLQQIDAQQKNALDVISGFVSTQQLGELQTEGMDLLKRIAAPSDIAQGAPKGVAQRPESAQQGGDAPSPPPSDVLSAGITDRAQQNDPRFQNTGNVLGQNPLNGFELAVAEYQQELQHSEGRAAQQVMQAVRSCGGTAPGQAPATQPTPHP